MLSHSRGQPALSDQAHIPKPPCPRWLQSLGLRHCKRTERTHVLVACFQGLVGESVEAMVYVAGVEGMDGEEDGEEVDEAES